RPTCRTAPRPRPSWPRLPNRTPCSADRTDSPCSAASSASRRRPCAPADGWRSSTPTARGNPWPHSSSRPMPLTPSPVIAITPGSGGSPRPGAGAGGSTYSIQVTIVTDSKDGTAMTSTRTPVAATDLTAFADITDVALTPDGQRVVAVIAVPDIESNTYRRQVVAGPVAGG